MIYHLSTDIIVKTLQAMAALQSMACDEDERALLAPVLCKGRNGLLLEIVRNAFIETVVRLGPLVNDMDLSEPTDDVEGCVMTVDLVVPRSFGTARNTVIRHAFEQLVAFTTLHLWCISSRAEADNGVSARLAEDFRKMSDDRYEALMSALTPDPFPMVRV